MALHRPTPVNRLLTELSWCLKDAKLFRDGGLRDENVLTVHVLQALDLLPRPQFLGAVLRAADGQAVEALERAAAEAEQAELTVLPNDPFLATGRGLAAQYPRVQPDGILTSPGAYIWVEAKRADGGSFQPDQLAREYYCVTKAAAGRSPLLLLLTGDPPPLAVQKHGPLHPHAAVAAGLAERYARHGPHPEPLEALLAAIPGRVAWLTWARVAEVLEAQLAAAAPLAPEVRSAFARIVAGACGAIAAQRAGAPPLSLAG